MRNLIKKLGIWSIGLAVLSACSSDDTVTPETPDTTPSVYVSGHMEGKAGYWKNGTFTALTEVSDHSSVSDIYVTADNTIYISGTDDSRASYWKDGKRNYLADSYSHASGIYADDKNVFVAGEYNSDTLFPKRAVVWKNGTAHPIVESDYDNSVHFSVFGMEVFQGKPYVYGSVYTNDYVNYGTMWEWNDNKNKFWSSEGNSTYSDVYIYKDIRYASGSLDGKACGWILEDPEILSPEANLSRAYAVAVDKDGNVYFAGFEDSSAVLWKNPWSDKTKIVLDSNNGEAVDIQIHNNDIYVLGRTGEANNGKWVVWKNGKVFLTLKENAHSDFDFASSLFIK